MKTRMLLSTIAFAVVLLQETYSKPATDQVCTGDVTLSSQAEVDAFSCTELTGNLTISGSDITNLDNLTSLRKVSGVLRIENNPNLITLDSLLALDSIGGNLPVGNPPLTEAPEALIIVNNAGLLHCDRLSSLHSINGGLRIDNNANLVSLNGFQNLKSVSWIDVSENSKLFEMFGFSNVGAIADRSNFPGRLTIRQNDNLVVLQDFPALTTVGDIRILNNNKLSDLNKFVNLTKINGYLEISGNGALSSIEGFRNLTTIAGFSRFVPSSGLIISNNASLRFITGLVSLQVVTSEFYVEVSIFNNPKLENIDGLASLTTIFGLYERKLNLNNNTALENIDGLSSLIHMDAGPGPLFIKVTQNPALTSCCGLRPLLEVFDSLNVLDNLIATGNINISGNGAGCTPNDILAGPSCFEEICGGNIELSSQAEVDAFNCTEVIGNLIISGSDITNLNSLSSLKSVSQILRIEDNINLKTLDGLSSLESVPEIYIRNNPALTDINMLSSLKTVGSLWIDSTKIVTLNGFSSLVQLGGLYVMNNSSLLSISGFDSVRSGPGITIINNAALRSINAFNNISSLSDISIRMNPNLLAIDGFLSVETVQHFTVSNNESLKSIGGFGKLIRVSNPTSLSAGLTITDNASLEDLSGLSSLKSIANPYLAVVSISNNRSLKNLDGFSSLSAISGNTSTQLHIVNNEMLENIDALALVRMEPPLNINVMKNPSLNSCCGLRRTLGSLEESMILDDLIANGDINISENGAGCTVEDILQGPRCQKEIEICDASTLSSQAEVDAFACKVVNGALVISGNDITDLSPLSILERAGTVIIRNNDQLQNVEEFTSITHIEQQLIIAENPALLTITGFNNLKSAGSGWLPSISISKNPKLTTLNGFQSLQDTHSISIQDNNSLASINGFSSLFEVKGIEVNGNSSLKTIDAFSALESIVEGLSLGYNNSLKSFNGFKRVTRIGGFGISNNPSLEDLEGLSSLKTLRRDNVIGPGFNDAGFSINENSSLKNLDGLASLLTVGEGNDGASISITNNAVLESIDGISALRVRSSDLSRVFIHVKDNPLLTRCCPLFPLLDALGEEGISKATIEIANNGSGCTLNDVLDGGVCPAVPTILGFDLIDLRSGHLVMHVHHDSITLDLADPRFFHLMLQANTAPQRVGSVEFIFDGHLRRTENGFPYQFVLPVLTPGMHTVRAEVYSKGQKQGVKGVGRTAILKVINSASVTRFDLVNLSGQTLMTLHDGDEINIKDPAFKTFLIRANTVPIIVSKVEFFLNNRRVAVENGFPYELLVNGPRGDYTLEAIPYIRVRNSYYPGTSMKIKFKLVSEDTGTHGQLVMNDLSDNESLRVGGETAGVTIFPVPVDDALHIKIDDTVGKDPLITIRTIHGLTVYQESYSKSQSINTLHLSAGVYYLQVAGPSGFQKVIRFLKK